MYRCINKFIHSFLKHGQQQILASQCAFLSSGQFAGDGLDVLTECQHLASVVGTVTEQILQDLEGRGYYLRLCLQ